VAISNAALAALSKSASLNALILPCDQRDVPEIRNLPPTLIFLDLSGNSTSDDSWKVVSRSSSLAVLDVANSEKELELSDTAWIHSDAGDDEMVDWYFTTRPAKSLTQRLLRDEGSEILEDFEIIEL
jgi:hypothetical protein